MKISTKIFLLFFLEITISIQAQNAELKKKIVANYDLKESVLLSEDFESKLISSKKIALKIANERNLPIQGLTKNNEFFELKGVDELGNLIYYKNFNAKSRITSNVNDISTGGSLALDLNGENMLVAVLDGKPALDTHVEFFENNTSRIVLRDVLPNLTSLTSDEIEEYEQGRLHATHVTGTIAASGKSANSKGMAPKAKILSYDWSNDTSKMINVATNDGVLVSNHSYGLSAVDEDGEAILPEYYFGFYEGTARDYDRIAFQLPYYQPVVAAGNDRLYYNVINPSKRGNDLLLGASTSKNAIIVAAVREVLNYTSPASVVMSSFSSYGPTDDFRIKPDISAKGVDVYSSLYLNPDPITASPVNNYYYQLSGTSMASPAVAGIIALWQQWAILNTGTAYKSATIRALMAHTADEAGTAPGPDHKFGWGLINAKKGVEIMINNQQDVSIIEEKTLNNGGEYSKLIEIVSPGNSLTATIAWTDPEGDVDWSSRFNEDNSTPVLINDLDIRVYKNGEEFFPWKLNKNFNDLRAIKEDNDVDNIEKIEIENAPVGEYEIKVTHKGNLMSGKQDFSLIISNGNSSDKITLLVNDDVITEEDIKIYPNPVSDILTVNIPNVDLSEKTNYTISDISGKVVYKVTNADVKYFEIPVNNLANGLYFLEISNGLVKTTKKFIKN